MIIKRKGYLTFDKLQNKEVLKTIDEETGKEGAIK